MTATEIIHAAYEAGNIDGLLTGHLAALAECEKAMQELQRASDLADRAYAELQRASAELSRLNQPFAQAIEGWEAAKATRDAYEEAIEKLKADFRLLRQIESN